MAAINQLQLEADNAKEKLLKYSNKDYIFKNAVRQINTLFKTIAWHEWFNNSNMQGFKDGLYNSTLTLIRANENFGTLSHFMQQSTIPLCELALTDSEFLIEEFSKQDYRLRVSQNMEDYYSNLVQNGESPIYCALLLASINKDLQRVQELLQILDSNPGAKKKNKWFQGEVPFFEGLIENDSEKIRDTIEVLTTPRLHKQKNSYNGLYKELISFPAIGYAKIAWINGIEIEFNSKYIPNELLPVVPNKNYENKIDGLIASMTLESEYKYYNGLQEKVRNDVYDVFVFTSPTLHGSKCVNEHLVPNVLDSKPNFVGLTSGKQYKNGMLIGTNFKTDEMQLLKKVRGIGKVGFFQRKKVKAILKNYLDDIDEISKTERGVIIEIGEDYKLKYKSEKPQEQAVKRKPLSKKRKDALTKLGALCLEESSQKLFNKSLQSLKNYDGDEEFGSTLNYLTQSLFDEGVSLFISLDWKADLIQFQNVIAQTVKENYGLEVNLDFTDMFEPKANISTEGVIKYCRDYLVKNNLDLVALDSGGDNYIFLVTKMSDREDINKLIDILEFKQMK